MEYKSVAQMAEQWGISERRVRILCQQGKITGVIRRGRTWLIPSNEEKPIDGRTLRYQRNNSPYTELFSKVDAAVDAYRHRPLTQGESDRIRKEFLIKFAYSSNAIEGNTLTLQETALVLDGIVIDKKPLKDHMDIVGHRDAFLYVENLVNNNTLFTERVIKQIHTLVLMDKPKDRGIYRLIPVENRKLSHVLSDPTFIPEQMKSLVAEFTANHKLHPIERAALFHLKFESIHPFIDGNGRTGRLILNLMLMQAGYKPIAIGPDDLTNYQNAINAYHQYNDTNAMIKVIANKLICSTF